MSETTTKTNELLNAHELVASLVPAGGRVLDLGCGFGRVAELLRGRGCRVTGVEPDAERRAAASAYCERVLDGVAERLGELDLEPSSFEAIVFADVLEHLVDPWTTLKDVQRYLKPGGRIVISLPNFANFGVRMNLLKGEFTYQDGGIYDRTHLRFFTQQTAEELVRRAGLQVVERRFTSNLSETGPFRRLARVLPPLRRPIQRFDRTLTYGKPNLYALQFIMACER